MKTPIKVIAMGIFMLCFSKSFAQFDPPGTLGNTLRDNGTKWLSDNFLYNNGSVLGVGTTTIPSGFTMAINGSLFLNSALCVNSSTGGFIGFYSSGSSTGVDNVLGTGYQNLNCPDNLIVTTSTVQPVSGPAKTGNTTITTGNVILNLGGGSGTAGNVIIQAGNVQSGFPSTITGYGNVQIQPNGGNVGIGVTNPTNKLDVCGTIRGKEVIVSTGWCDFVFDKNYKLMSLADMEKYVQVNHHLPDVPSASDVEQNGVKVGETEAALLKQIEELTLHLIAINKENEELKKQNEDVLKRLSAIEEKIK